INDTVYKREKLLDFKNRYDIMSSWSVDMFAYFLYNIYPIGPNRGRADSRLPEFPANAIPEEVDLSINRIMTDDENHDKSIKGKSDFEKQAKKWRQYGDRGEKLVMDFEVIRLKKAGYPDLAKKVKRVSLESDSYGYDILSYNGDKSASERYIEVKATTRKVGITEFFITANELAFATGKNKRN